MEKDFLDKINDHNRVLANIKGKNHVVFDKNTEFYLLDAKKPYHILSVLKEDNVTNKQTFSLGGVSLTKVTVTITENNQVSRVMNNKSLKLIDNKLVHMKKFIRIKPLLKSDVLSKKSLDSTDFV